jgi:uncharacterized phage protein (TIGR01671 family)
MRKVKFRGYSNETKKWYYGNYEKLGDVSSIVYSEKHMPRRRLRIIVDPESVGEWTGLQDRHGKDIYEGDIIKGNLDSERMNLITSVEFESGSFMGHTGAYLSSYYNVQVIGNIYEHPELLEKKE